MKINDKTLVAVSAYAGDLHQVENNLEIYQHHKCPVLILSPEDRPIRAVSDPSVICMMDGQSGWIGPHTLERHKKYLEILLKFPHEHFLFHDADSVCLSPEIPQYLYDHPDIIWSNEVLDTNPGPSLLPKIAMQPPYWLSRNSIKGLLKASLNLPTSYYGEAKSPEGWPLPFPTNCIDHYMLQLAHGSGYPHLNFHTGASFETASEHGLETMAELVRNHGKVLLHSVKSREALGRLIDARNRRA